MGKNILREHPVLAILKGGTVSGGTVEPDRTGGGFAGGQTAGQQSRHHTGQHIAAPTPGKTWIAGGVDADAAIRGGANVRCALIGQGVQASHHMERTHVKGMENTLELIKGYIGL